MSATFSLRELAFATHRPADEIARLLNHAGCKPPIPPADPPLNLRIPRDLVARAELIATGRTKEHLRTMLMVTDHERKAVRYAVIHGRPTVVVGHLVSTHPPNTKNLRLDLIAWLAANLPDGTIRPAEYDLIPVGVDEETAP